MIGNWNVNHDVKQINYDFPVGIPFMGKFYLTRQHLETAQKYLDGTQKDITEFNTNQLDGIILRGVAFGDLPGIIEKVEIFLKDLKELGEEIKKTPPHPPLNQEAQQANPVPTPVPASAPVTTPPQPQA